MAETDILNPVRRFWDELNDNPNWSYGWIRKTASNKSLARPRLGRRYSRETMNGGYSANLNWIDRPYSTVLYLKKFYEQFQGGYFTLIDYDGFGRHHVGNFTTEPQGIETANGKYTIQGLTFEEAPQARMLEYPSMFGKSSHPIFAVDDYLNPQVATSGNWIVNSLVDHSVAPGDCEMLNRAPIAGDFAQVEYVGWGFQMAFRTAPQLGLIDIYVDGVKVVPGFDLSAAIDYSAQPWWVAAGDGQPARVRVVNMPLDKHRVKVVALDLPGSASAGIGGPPNGAIFPAIEVMH